MRTSVGYVDHLGLPERVDQVFIGGGGSTIQLIQGREESVRITWFQPIGHWRLHEEMQICSPHCLLSAQATH
jgi:hypothetical protein